MLDVKAEGRALASGEAHSARRLPHGRVPGSSARRASRCSRGASSPRPIEQGVGEVVILNKTLADQLFPNRDPIGQRVAWTGEVLKFIGLSDEWRTVVGVVGDTKDGGLDAEPRGAMFQPMKQEAMFGGGLVIRCAA